MSLYVISDTHLSLSASKPMDVFGARWEYYVEKIEQGFCKTVTDSDTVVIAGDISWGMSLEEATLDLKFISNLPGRKIISRGNHDYWWTTLKKMYNHLEENGVTNINFLQNNAYEVEDYVICGTRGWYVDEKAGGVPKDTDYQKIVNREVKRLELSLSEGEKIRERTGKEILTFFHFPPCFGNFVCRELIDVLHKFGATRCYYGHIHGNYSASKVTCFEGLSFTLTSSDFLDFTPLKVNEM